MSCYKVNGPTLTIRNNVMEVYVVVILQNV